MIVYLAALVVLLMTSFWVEDDLTGHVVHTWTLDNFRQLWDQPVYRIITRNTLVMAIVVTVTDTCSRSRSPTTWRGWPRRGCGRCSSSPS